MRLAPSFTLESPGPPRPIALLDAISESWRLGTAGCPCCIGSVWAVLSGLMLVMLCGVSHAFGHVSEGAEELVLREGFVLTPGRGPGSRGRVSLPKDPIEAAWLAGRLQLPDSQFEQSPSGEGLPNWRKIMADDGGGFSDRALSSGWLVCYVDVPSEGIWLLHAQGHGQVRVNGVPRTGDIYGNGMTELPIKLKAGRNTLIFIGSRGRITAKLRPASERLYLSQRDTTYPHVVRGELEPLWGGLLVVNATDALQTGLRLRVGGEGCVESVTEVPALLPLSVRKVPFSVTTMSESPIHSDLTVERLDLTIELLPSPASEDDAVEPLGSLETAWGVRSGWQQHRRTFLSGIDGSVQYYAVAPPSEGSLDPASPPALLMSLHGAGVEGEGQAACFAPKPNAYVIAPTNRRVFGFDWEDWGRWDALEVLEAASRRFGTDPRRTYLSGHSMGGHGTWHIGTLYPNRFAALGPSAGWISFSSYAGGPGEPSDGPLAEMLRRAVGPSDTLARVENLASQAVYILHGDADDNVPVGQARSMREQLASFHPNFVYKEQPGAGHWWGNACVDWPAMYAYFIDHQLPLPQQVNRIDFTTPAPHVSSRYAWMDVVSQQQQGLPSRVQLQLDRGQRRLTGTTTNVLRIRLDAQLMVGRDEAAAEPTMLSIELDGSRLEDIPIGDQPWLYLERSLDGWRAAEPYDNPGNKTGRNGTFKEAFRGRFILVYGTGGSAQENDWMLDRARYDAETFWYRGNGSVDVISDQQWTSLATVDRNVIVYGNASINAAWQELLAESPVAVRAGGWQADGAWHEESASVLMIRPRAGSDVASVGAIGGTDLVAMQASNRLPLFSSGTGYPDLTIFSPEYLERGIEAIRLVGYFGHDWSFGGGEWARP